MKQLFQKGTALLLILCVLALTPTVPARRALAAEGEVQFVRVLLSTEGASKLSIPVTGSYTLVEAGRTFSGGTLTVLATGSGVSVSHSAEGALYSGRTATVERLDLARSAGSMRIRVVSGTRAFLGHFTFSSSNGALRVVNRVPLSHYLYGVVGYEMSDTFPLEALKAQAVAAKGYVLLRMSNSGSYDIGDTASDQVYKGYVSSDTNVINAVDSTINDVLYYHGKPMQCYYAASNGGWMILPGTRWSDDSEDGAYAQGADDYDLQNPSSPRETVFLPTSYSQREMGTRAFAFVDARMSEAIATEGLIPDGFRFSGIRSVDAVESSGNAGSAADKNHTTVTVTATVLADLLKERIPTPTPELSPTPSPTPEWEPTPSPTPEYVAPTPTLEPVAPLEGEEGYEDWIAPSPTPEEPVPTPTPELSPTPSPTPAWDPTPSPTPEPELVREIPVSFSFTFAEMAAAGLYTSESLRIYYAEPVDGGFNLLHARYGHGVGMSQRGAQQMAAAGKSYREILNYYYPGAQLGAMGFVSPERVSAPAATEAVTAASSGTVINGKVHLRKSPSTKGESLEKLPVGTDLTLAGIQGEWYYVIAPSGNKGFVRYDYVLLTGESMIATGVVNASAVNYRTGPDTSFDAIGRLSRDTQLGIYGMEDGWYKVMAVDSGTVGFIKGNYVKITNSLADKGTTVPMITPAPTDSPAPLAPGETPGPIVIGVTTPEPPIPYGTPTPVPTAAPGPIYAASGYINASRVNLRAGASTSTKSYGRLERNTQLGVYEKTGAWYRVQVLASGQAGYVYGKYVSLQAADAQVGGGATSGQVSTVSRGYITASGVQLRGGPGTGYDSLGKLSRNTTVTVLGTSGSWVNVEVRASGTQGYVFSKYVAMTGIVKRTEETGVITARLNLRTSPTTGSGSRVLLVMEKGALVTVLSTVNGWCQVNYAGTTGYCISSCVRRDG